MINYGSVGVLDLIAFRSFPIRTVGFESSTLPLSFLSYS